METKEFDTLEDTTSLPKPNIWVFRSRELDMKSEAEQWVVLNQNTYGRKNFQGPYLLPPSSSAPKDFSKIAIQDNDVICIHCHGFATKDSEKQAMFVSKQESLSPQDFAERLKENNLPKDKTIELHLLACYSDEFANKLQSLLQSEYPGLTIYGYKEEFNLCQGLMGGSLAGLDEKVVTKHKGHAMIDNQKIESIGKKAYDSFAHCVAYGPNAKNTSTLALNFVSPPEKEAELSIKIQELNKLSEESESIQEAPSKAMLPQSQRRSERNRKKPNTEKNVEEESRTKKRKPLG